MGARVYSDSDRDTALLALAANRGNVKHTADALNMPEQTLRDWKAEDNTPDREKKRGSLAVQFEHMAEVALGVALEKIDQADAYHAALISGISTDKARLLKGEATAINESRSINLSMLSDEEVDTLRMLTAKAEGTPVSG